MSNNLRGAYMAFEHDRPSDWRWLERWQPSVIRLMMNGKHGDPASVDVNRIARVHRTCPDALILLRVWEMDDRNYEAHREMYADPLGAAQQYHAWWRALIDRLPNVPRDRLMAGAWNEPVPVNASQASALYAASEELARLGTQDSVRYGVYVWSVGKPPKDGEDIYDWAHWRKIEPALLAGNHAVILHEYAQKEGMYGVWTDDQGNERRDWTNLMGRHLESGLERVPVIIGEWGIDGILFNRDRHPEYGHNGWRNFGALWGSERYADEYVEYIRQCAPNVIGVCPFISDHGDRKWFSFDPEPAYGALLSRKHLCEREPTQTHTVHIPVVIAPPDPTSPEPTALPPVTQPPADDWAEFQRCYAFTRRWEGGWANHPADKGGPTMRGITLATFTEWRHAQGMGTPTADDLRNIRDDEVEAIYYQRYWKPSGAASLHYPANLVRFDTAVLFGVDVALWYAQEAGPSEYALLGLRLLGHAGSVEDDPSQAEFWNGWRGRVMELRAIVRQARGWS